MDPGGPLDLVKKCILGIDCRREVDWLVATLQVNVPTKNSLFSEKLMRNLVIQLLDLFFFMKFTFSLLAVHIFRLQNLFFFFF